MINEVLRTSCGFGHRQFLLSECFVSRNARTVWKVWGLGSVRQCPPHPQPPAVKPCELASKNVLPPAINGHANGHSFKTQMNTCQSHHRRIVFANRGGEGAAVQDLLERMSCHEGTFPHNLCESFPNRKGTEINPNKNYRAFVFQPRSYFHQQPRCHSCPRFGIPAPSCPTFFQQIRMP